MRWCVMIFTGDKFAFSLGNTLIVYVNQPDVVKEITTCTTLDLGKPSYQFKERGPLMGQGILTSNGPHWAHQRKILAPELYMEKVKVCYLNRCLLIPPSLPPIFFSNNMSEFAGRQGMINLINESTETLLKSWKDKVDAAGGVANINIDQHMRSFSGDVISRACFGSNFAKGEEIFHKLRALQEAMSKKVLSTGIPGMR